MPCLEKLAQLLKNIYKKILRTLNGMWVCAFSGTSYLLYKTIKYPQFNEKNTTKFQRWPNGRQQKSHVQTTTTKNAITRQKDNE